jgi:hypothetical protein
MSRRYSILLAASLAFCALVAFVVLPRPRTHAQAKSSIAFVNVNVLPLDKAPRSKSARSDRGRLRGPAINY